MKTFNYPPVYIYIDSISTGKGHPRIKQRLHAKLSITMVTTTNGSSSPIVTKTRKKSVRD